MGGYSLPQAWTTAITGWVGWLRLSGMAPSSVVLRRDHLRSIARRTATESPAALVLDDIVIMFSASDWSREYRKSIRSSLVSFCAWCVQRDLMSVNLGEALPRVQAPRGTPRPASEQQWEDLLASAAPRERLMARLAGELGMRRGEVAAASLRDLIRDAGGWSLIVNGKGGKQRVIPVPDGLAREILQSCPGGYLFPNDRGGHLSPRYVGWLISHLLEGASMHQLRHRFATCAYRQTHDLRALQRVLGHSSLATTERYVLGALSDERGIVEAVAKVS